VPNADSYATRQEWPRGCEI